MRCIHKLMVVALSTASLFVLSAMNGPDEQTQDADPTKQADDRGLPAGHPVTTPQLPSGHPRIQAPEAGDATASIANPADVESVDAIVSAYYGSLSGAKGEPRDWARYLSLFLADARCMTVRPRVTSTGASWERAATTSFTPQRFSQSNDKYLVGGGYFAVELKRGVNEYDHIAQVFSTFESRRALAAEPYARGINSFQLVSDGERWWIASILWDHERPEENPIPEEYLPSEIQEN